MEPATPFVLPGGLASVDYPAFLSRHDVVYLAPAPDGIDGLPVGNGDLGAMLWTPPDQLRLALNKVDLWDDGPDGPFGSWSEEAEEVSTMLRAAGVLTFSNGLPLYDRLYLTDFAARVCLADARVELRAETPFGRASAEVLASSAFGVLVVRYRDETEEPLPRRVGLERWGTRSLLHWYRRIKRDVPLSLRGTRCGTDGQHLWIEQELRALRFAVVLRLAGPNGREHDPAGDGPVPASPRVLHRRAGLFESTPTRAFSTLAYLAVVNSEEADDPLAAAIARVDAAADAGPERIAERHRADWRRFWEASFVSLPPEQEYVENLWYLTSYQLASASRGRYPLNHIHALWGWNRDVFPWAHYYHWNTQPHTWPLHASGHGELVRSYFRWRRAQLEIAVEDAGRVHGRPGAFYSDVSNRKGYQATEPGLSHNLTPGPQIALTFWRHYQYTRDDAFLRDDAYPVLREVSRFYLATLARRPDGRYTFVGTQPYESALLTRDTLTDLAHARALFRAFVEASSLLGRDAELRARCEDALAHLAEYVTLPVATESGVAPDSIMDLRPIVFKPLAPGDATMPIWHVGYKAPGSRSPHADELPDGAPVHEGMCDPARHLWIFTSTTIAPVFPASQVGLDDAGTPAFEAAVNTVRALGYDNEGFSLWIIAKARLGLADELRRSLEGWPQSFQLYPNGFAHWALPDHPDMEEDPRYLKQIGVVGSPDERVHWPIAATSIHMSVEALPILQTAVNEMLLQSYSGTLRVFPAVPADWSGAFRLHAVGRFVVGARRTGGRTSYVVVESHGGEPCRLATPWPGEALALYARAAGGWAARATLGGDVVTFPTGPGDVLLALPVGLDPAGIEPIAFSGTPNQGPKTLGKARLGVPKGY